MLAGNADLTGADPSGADPITAHLAVDLTGGAHLADASLSVAGPN